MLGGDKEFNDRLCWALMLPLAAMAGFAAVLALMMLELVLEGDVPGGASAWMGPLKGFAMAYAGILMGAKVAPSRRLAAAVSLSFVCLAGAARWARQRPSAPFLAAAALGAALACVSAARIPPDPEPNR